MNSTANAVKAKLLEKAVEHDELAYMHKDDDATLEALHKAKAAAYRMVLNDMFPNP